MSVLYWNCVLLEASRRDFTKGFVGGQQPGPIRTSRAMAIVHLAIHDAVAFHSGSVGSAYLTKKGIPHAVPPLPAGATLDAVVAGAAVTAIRAMYPNHSGPIDDSLSNETGYPVGVAIARALVDYRSRDGWDVMLHDDQLPMPGHFEHRADPHQPGEPGQRRLGPKWGKVWRFTDSVLDADGHETHHEHLDPWPQSDYPAQLREVRDHGGAQRGARSAEQERIGVYWGYDGANGLGVPPRLYNQVARRIVDGKGLTEAQLADLFARLNVAMADAAIDAWHWKYHYNLWRPAVGVRLETSADGDPFWCPHGIPRTNNTPGHYTPDFPAYPSGHATFGAALFQVLRLALATGNGPIPIADVLAFGGGEKPAAAPSETFSFVSDELDGASLDADGSVRTRVEKRFDSFAEAVWENSVSRVYLGVHWRFDGIPSPDDAASPIGGVPLGLAIGEKTNDFFNAVPGAISDLP
ncbi:vanadium-dependent haloperoxidase [Phenylobacterium kunshanense]|nr:vanadium-dependent haloperoxidase [Phenylobacterium kunshanense]